MRNMSLRGLILVLLLASAAVLVQACRQSEPAEKSKQPAEQTKEPAEAAGAGDLEPIVIDLPDAVFEGTPEPRRYGTHVEKLLGKPRPPFMAPKGTTNVALKKPVSGSDEFPIIGELKLITDGDKEALDGRFVELGPGRQYVQIDLGAEYNIYAVVIWHRHQEPRVYHDVIVQACSDPDFITDVKTVFNNDFDNSAGLGVGENWERIETNEGHLIDAKGVKGRYVRCYSYGNTTNDLNHYIEVEVYGKPAPAEPSAEPKKPAEQPKEPAEEAAKPAEQPKQPAEAAKEPAEASGDGDLEPIVIELPELVMIEGLYALRFGPKVERPLWGPRPPFKAPKGTTNVALKKPVRGSDEEPIIGELKLITDGDKEASDGNYVELGPGLQYVQIDLGAEYNIYAVVIWHDYPRLRVYHDVVVQVSSAPDFSADVKTVFNNDYDNSSGLGLGENLEFVGFNQGYLIDSKGVKGRYVRLYSNGNTTDDFNHYTEVEVYGKPAP